MRQRRFAVFDIDGTIFRWQLYHELFDAFVDEGIIAPKNAQRVFEAREQWRNRQSNYHDYEETLMQIMRLAVVGLEETEFNRIADLILRAKGHRTYRYTLELLQDLKKQSYVIIAISGSYQQLVNRFAALHGIDIAVGREHTIIDGKLTNESTQIFGRKELILHELIEAHNLSLDGSYAIGDSSGDIAMLQMVAYPIAFNPDEALRQTAMESGWPIVIERKSISYTLERGPDGSYLLA